MRTLNIQLCLLALLCISKAKAQYPLDIKSDYVWLSGYGTSPPFDSTVWGTSIIDFKGQPDTSYLSKGIHISFSVSSVCDTAGNLLLFSQGFKAFDNNFDLIEGADSLGCCTASFNNYSTSGLRIIDGVLALKQPGVDDKISIFYTALDFFYLPPEGMVAYSLGMRQTTIVQEADTFRAISKDIIQYPDSLYGAGNIEACRHANGRDWWIIQQHFNQHRFHVYLFDPQGLHNVNDITLPGFLPFTYAQANFSPDGSSYVIAGMQDEFNDSLFVARYDFDRCSGMLSNPQYYSWKEDTLAISSGSAFSSNGKYLYVSSTFYVHQFDMSQANWQNTNTIVAVREPFIAPNGAVVPFGRMQLAPDGKIYITAGPTVFYHTIDKPNESGTACEVNQHSFRMPSISDRTISNFPNYRLGPIDGSPCDTLGIDNIVNINDKLDNNSEPVKLFPNPASDYITLFVPRITRQWQFALYDIQGREVLHVNSRGAFRSINISHLAQGMYLWKLVYEDGKQEQGKVIIQK